MLCSRECHHIGEAFNSYAAYVVDIPVLGTQVVVNNVL